MNIRYPLYEGVYRRLTDKVIPVIIIHAQYRRGSQGDLGGKRISFQVIGLTRSLEPGSLYYDVLQRVSRISQGILAGPRQDDPSKSVRYTEGPFPFGTLLAVLYEDRTVSRIIHRIDRIAPGKFLVDTPVPPVILVDIGILLYRFHSLNP